MDQSITHNLPVPMQQATWRHAANQSFRLVQSDCRCGLGGLFTDCWNGFMGAILWFWHGLSDFVSGEFFLNHYANGGAVISLRALWIALWLWSCAVLLVHFLDRGFEYGWATLRWEWLKPNAFERLTWFGGLLAASYAGLYARFSSQWTYVAGVYNQIKAAESRKDVNEERIAQWKAGYVEDAEDLHLATKPTVATTILIWLEDERVRNAFEKDTPGNFKRLAKLRPRLEDAKARQVAKYV